MKLLLIGTDRNLFTPGSAVRERIARFGTNNTDTLDSIVFSTHAHGISESQEIAPRVHVHPTNAASRFLYGWSALKVARTLPRPDIVSAQDPFETGLVALLVARHFRVPLVVEIHTDFLAPEFARHSLINYLRVCIASFVIPRAAGGYTVSQRTHDELVKKYKPKASFGVFPIFIDIQKFRLIASAPLKGNLLWVGRLTPEKNPVLALHAFKAACVAGHDVRLTILGTGELDMSLKEVTKELELEEKVTFAGWQNPAVYLPQTELVLATSRYEGYGMSIVEALAAGVPVLSTEVGVAREAGAVISEGDYAKSLIDWLNGPRTRGALQLHTYKDEEEYFSAVQKYYESLYTASSDNMANVT